jgi:hypothetical protein
LQAVPQLVPSQVALPFDGTGHGEQLDPQLFTLELERQLFEHRCDPAPQVAQTLPAQYWLVQSAGTEQATPSAQVLFSATQMPPQSVPVSLWFLIESEQESATQDPLLWWNPPLQLTSAQVPALQVPTPFGYRRVQSVQPAPQQLLWAATQAPPEGTNPALQPVRMQAPEEQEPVPLLNAVAQSVQEAPQQLTVSAAQAAPLAWNPPVQVKTQTSPLQAGVPFATRAQSAAVAQPAPGPHLRAQLPPQSTAVSSPSRI